MKDRWLLFFVMAFVVLNLVGCASLKKKFTRKPAQNAKKELFTKVKKYDVKPSPELYGKHYIFWINWHKKLVAELGKSRKSDMRSMREMISNLEDMAALISDEKANGLRPHIDELEKAKTIIAKRSLTTLNKTRVRRIIEREYRNIHKRFPPKKMADYIRKDWR